MVRRLTKPVCSSPMQGPQSQVHSGPMYCNDRFSGPATPWCALIGPAFLFTQVRHRFLFSALYLDFKSCWRASSGGVPLLSLTHWMILCGVDSPGGSPRVLSFFFQGHPVCSSVQSSVVGLIPFVAGLATNGSHELCSRVAVWAVRLCASVVQRLRRVFQSCQVSGSA